MKLTSYEHHHKKRKQQWLWSGKAKDRPRCNTCIYYDGRVHRMFCEKGEFITQPSDTCIMHEAKPDE